MSTQEFVPEFRDQSIADGAWVAAGGAWLVAETLVWVAIMGHIIHWAADAVYYLSTQVSYMTVAKGGTPVTVIGSTQPGDWWDRFTVHIAHILGLHNTILNNNGEAAPLWWITWRHDARYLLIGILTGVAVTFLTSKPPKNRKDYTWYRMAATPVLAFVYALPGVIAGGLVIWVTNSYASGFNPPASWGIAGHELGQWVGSGKLAVFLLGLFASQFFAKLASRGPADEAQWLYAGRKANSILRERRGKLAGVANLRDALVIGPPGYRRRVRHLVANNIVSEGGGTGMTVTLALFAFVTVILAGYGAWLTLVGPAAGH